MALGTVSSCSRFHSHMDVDEHGKGTDSGTAGHNVCAVLRTPSSMEQAFASAPSSAFNWLFVDRRGFSLWKKKKKHGYHVPLPRQGGTQAAIILTWAVDGLSKTTDHPRHIGMHAPRGFLLFLIFFLHKRLGVLFGFSVSVSVSVSCRNLPSLIPRLYSHPSSSSGSFVLSTPASRTHTSTSTSTST